MRLILTSLAISLSLIASVLAEVPPTVRVRGTVVFPDGKPAANMEVQAAGAGFSPVRSSKKTTTDAEGRYEFQAVPNQIYLVVVNDAKWSAPPRTGFAV